MNYFEISNRILERKQCLCIGLDPDPEKIPTHLKKFKDGWKIFLLEIIEATKDFCFCYKPNSAFFENLGPEGFRFFSEIPNLLPNTNYFTIADCKRGDIGNTAQQYAESVFQTMNYSAITVSPYMGMDSLEPFLQYDSKWSILLGLTSNAGNQDIQKIKTEKGVPIYQHTMQLAAEKSAPQQLMFVIGATQPEELHTLRQLFPDYFFLIPGIGAQGGDLASVLKAGLNPHGGLLINVGRDILYASSGLDYAQAAREKALSYCASMSAYF